MVLPYPVDLEIAFGQSLLLKTGSGRRSAGGKIAGHDVGLHPVEAQGAEAPAGHGVDGLAAVALPPQGVIHLIREEAGLERPPDDLVEPHQAHDLPRLPGPHQQEAEAA